MHHALRPALAALTIALLGLCACSGNFGTGTGMPQGGGNMPPMGTTPMPETDRNGMPIGDQPTPSSSPGAVGSASYPIDDAKKGFACPQIGDGYGCTLSFNLPAPTPTPSPTPKGSKPTPTPSPTPTPTPTATPSPEGSASASPSPSPTPPSITLMAQAPPTNAPKMVHVPANTLDTVPLMMVQLSTNADLPLDGWANAQFTLPKSEVDGRGFAVQLFQVNKNKKGVDYKPIWTFDKSRLDDTTLTFSFHPPKMKIAKGSAYTLVLYGDDRSSSPAPSASGAASGADSASPSPGASAGPNGIVPEPSPSVTP